MKCRRFPYHNGSPVFEAGVAMVELAIALPLILLLVFGAFQIVFLVGAKTLLDHAAYEGARTGAIHNEPQQIEGRVKQVMAGVPRGAGFLGGEPRIETDEPGDSIRVTVYARIELLPFFRQAARAVGSNGQVHLSAASLVKKEPWLGFSTP